MISNKRHAALAYSASSGVILLLAACLLFTVFSTTAPSFSERLVLMLFTIAMAQLALSFFIRSVHRFTLLNRYLVEKEIEELEKKEADELALKIANNRV